MDFAKAFTYVFEDRDWLRKLLLPAVLLIIPILGIIVVMGWLLNITRRVIRGEPNPLIDLEFGRDIADGLKAFVVTFVYSIPSIILSIPSSATSWMRTYGGNDPTQNWAMVLLLVCCSGLSLLYGLFLAVALPAALGNEAATDNLSAGFRFSEVIRLVRSAPGAYLMVLLGVIISGILGSLGVILCVIGVFFTLAYAMAVNGHLYGQAYREATTNRTL